MRTLICHTLLILALLGLALGAPLRAQDATATPSGGAAVTATKADATAAPSGGAGATATKADATAAPSGGAGATATKADDAGKADAGKTGDAAKTPDAGKAGTTAAPASGGGSPFGFLATPSPADTNGENGAAPMDVIPDKPVDPDKVEVSVSFTKADIPNVLSFLSMASGVPIVVDADVKGQVTITALKKVTLSLAFEVINSALRSRGYAMVGTLKDTHISVVALKKALADKGNVKMGADPNALSDSDDFITQVVPLQYSSAAKLKDELKGLISDEQASLTAVSSTNNLIITDTEGNVKRFLKVVALLDKDTTDIVEVQIYQCKNANAAVLIQSVEKVFDVTKTTPSMPGMPQGQPPQPGMPGVATDNGVLSLRGSLRLASDDRTNSIIIAASRPKIDMVVSLLKQLDIDTLPEVHSKVYPLKNADANLVATQLNKLFQQPDGGTRTANNPFMFQNPAMMPTAKSYAGMKENLVVADVRTNSIIVTASETNLRQYDDMIAHLDAPSVLSDVTRVFPLKFATAKDLATSLTSLFRGQRQNFSFFDLYMGNSSSSTDGDPISQLNRITVVGETKSNSLLITGPPQCFTLVEQIINKLDKRAVQVYIEVAIVDVSLTDSTKFGVEWNWASKTLNADKTHTSTFGTDLGLSKETTGFRYNVISSSLQALLQTMATDSNVKVYSTPSITTADNVQAKITIGSDQPYVSSSEDTTTGGVRDTVDYKTVAVSLTVTPHVNDASNLIGLDVDQTINELLGTDATVLNSPIVANREAKTTVMVDDGQTIVIGGMIKENKDKEIQGVPWLSRIPLIGEAFKRHTNTGEKSELMVFITPHILRDDQSVKDVTNSAANKVSDPAKVLPNVTKKALKSDDHGPDNTLVP